MEIGTRFTATDKLRRTIHLVITARYILRDTEFHDAMYIGPSLEEIRQEYEALTSRPYFPYRGDFEEFAALRELEPGWFENREIKILGGPTDD